jgi:outer membrane protein assembly factor BamB
MRSSSTPRSWLALPLVAGAAVLALASSAPADDWPQWLGPQRDGVWREEGILDKFPPGGPKVRWRAKIGSGYAGPAVAGGKVYVTDYVNRPGEQLPASGFSPPGRRYKLPGAERVVCLDDATGKVLWTHEYETEYGIDYPAGPRTTPLVSGGKVYTLGAMGDLRCLDAETGKLLWAKNFPKDFGAPVQTWGFAAHPLLDGDRLICLVGGDGTGAVAFHKDTGTELWRSLSPRDAGYAPPMIYTVGRTRQLIVWTAEAVCALVPETGGLLWEEPFKVRAALSVPTPRFDGGRLLVTSFYNGALMLKLDPDKPGATVLWKGKGRSEKPNQTDTLHSIIPTPVLKDGYIYGVGSYGELRCLKADTGERVWKTMAATRPLKAGKPDESPETEKDRWGNAFLVPQGDRYFLFNERGELIIAKLSPKGYEEIDRARILEPDNRMPGRPVVWSHPAFAHRSVYARNDHEIVCVSLEK